jgi:peptide/nickel transport system permease protein
MSIGWRYLVRRVLISIFLLWLLTVITFALYYAIPSEPASFVIDVQHSSPERIAKVKHELGVDKPITTQYAKFLGRMVHGDFGVAWEGIGFTNAGTLAGEHVGAKTVRAAAVTGWLALGGIVILLVLAIPIATLAATRAGSFLDRTLLAVTLVGISTHPIVVGVLLQTFFGNRWSLAPPSGYCSLLSKTPTVTNVFNGTQPPTCGGVATWASHMILPWITFALFFVALYTRIIRVRLLEVLDSDYVRAARAKGASELKVLRRHALPNALLPVITMVGMDIGAAVGVAVYVETVYGLPGLGRLTIGAIAGDAGIDLPVIVAVVMVVGAAIVLLNLIADVLIAAIDPTIERRGPRRAHATSGVV